MQLTAEQQQIIQAAPGHCVITAVAGSGKTTTLAYRIRHLLQSGQDPRRLLILMFNRAARTDFERKLRQVCGNDFPRLPEIRTFHAMGYRLYQRLVQEGYLQAARSDILSEQEIHYQLWQLIRQRTPASLQDEVQRDKKDHIEIASSFIDLVKSTLSDPTELFQQLNYGARHDYLIELFEDFETWRKGERRISYADMLFEPVQLIDRHPELQQLVGNKMDCILVDEYQDTNEVQHLLLKYIAGSRAKVTVVGDPDQTIYAFRGARPDFLLQRFRAEFQPLRQKCLTYSFRYGHRLALLANHLITHNQEREDVLVRAHPGNPATEIELHRSAQEPEVILELLRRHGRAGVPLSDIAILVRVWSQAANIELALLAADIPYRIEQHKGALFSRELTTLMDLLAFADGRFADHSEAARSAAFQRILRFPHVGLKEPRLNELAARLGRLRDDWSEWLLEDLPNGFSPLQKKKLRQTARALAQLQAAPGSAGTAVARYCDDTDLFGNIRDLALTHDLAAERIDRIQGLQQYLQGLGCSCRQALEQLLQLKQRAQHAPSRQGLTLTSIHRSKGLEWPLVILPGLNDRYLPYLLKPAEDLPQHLQGERRLLYVALTRARQHLHLLAPPAASNRGDAAPSCFVEELHFEPSERLGRQLDKADTPHPQGNDSPICRRYLKLLQARD